MALFVWAAAIAGSWSVGANWKVGGTTQAAPPTASDDVLIGSGTGATNSNCTLDTTATILSINFTGYTGTFTYSSQTLNVTSTPVTFVNTMAITGNASSVLTCSVASLTFTGAGRSFPGTVNITGSGVSIVTGANTYVNFNRTGTAVQTDGLQINANFTVTGVLTFAGNSVINRLGITALVLGGPQKTITNTGATMTWSNVDISDVGLSTAFNASAITGGSGDCGGNTNITFTTGATQTWSGTSGGNWTANAWTTRVPLPQDNVVINAAFSASQTITMNGLRSGKDVDFTGVTGSPAVTTSGQALIYGSLILASGLGTITLTGALALQGRGSHSITSDGKAMAGANVLQQFTPNGTYTLTDDLNITAFGIQILSGTFTAGTKNVTASTITITTIQNAPIPVVNMGSGTWTTTSTATATVWSSGGVAAATINAQTSTIAITGVSANTRTFGGGAQTYNIVSYTTAGSTGILNVTGSNTFKTLNFSDVTNARTLRFTAGTTTTITTAFNVNGTAGKLMTIGSITAASHALSYTGVGYVSSDYLSISRSDATPASTWYAGANSTDGGNNSGWVFTIPPANTGNFFLMF